MANGAGQPSWSAVCCPRRAAYAEHTVRAQLAGIGRSVLLVKGYTRTGDQVSNCARHDDLTRRSHSHDSGRYADCSTAYGAVHELAFASVQAGSQLDPELSDSSDYRQSTTNCTCWPVEHYQETVTRPAEHPTALLLNLVLNECILSVDELAPTELADIGCNGCRRDRCHDKDGSQYLVGTREGLDPREE